MNRYINEDALLKAVEGYADMTRADLLYILEDIPTADVEEVRHGKWTKSSPCNRFMNCSSCGFGQNHTTFNYCPNCGAKMDGERREG